MTMESVSSLLDQFPEFQSDCPVCFEKFEPPVLQCHNGHLICQICAPRCRLCPECRDKMPRKRIRNIVFEKILLRIDNIRVPCVYRDLGCSIMIKKDDVGNHNLDCLFVKKKLCAQLGLKCEEESSGFAMHEMIRHFSLHHYLIGCIEEQEQIKFPENEHNKDSEAFPTASNPTEAKTCDLELVETCKKSDFTNFLKDPRFIQPNFLKFGGSMFFLIRKVDPLEKLVSFVVCIDASLVTARMYTATIGISCNSTSFTPNADKFKFQQVSIPLLSQSTVFEFTTDESRRLKYCQVSFSDLETYVSSTDDSEGELSWKIHITLEKKSVALLAKEPKTATAGSKSTSNAPLPGHAEIELDDDGDRSSFSDESDDEYDEDNYDEDEDEDDDASVIFDYEQDEYADEDWDYENIDESDDGNVGENNDEGNDVVIADNEDVAETSSDVHQDQYDHQDANIEDYDVNGDCSDDENYFDQAIAETNEDIVADAVIEETAVSENNIIQRENDTEFGDINNENLHEECNEDNDDENNECVDYGDCDESDDTNRYCDDGCDDDVYDFGGDGGCDDDMYEGDDGCDDDMYGDGNEF